jgi:hypothetical protein
MADPSNLPPLPKNHLDHPENWTTGSDPATDKQKGFIKVLEGQHAALVPEGGLDTDGMGKSEASEVIEKLKNGVSVKRDSGATSNGEEKAQVMEQVKGESKGSKVDASKAEDEEKTTQNKEESTGDDEDTAETDGKKRKSNPSTTADDKPDATSGDGEVTEDDATGKDLHPDKTKQTTLDSVVSSKSNGNGASTADENENGARQAKKPKLDAVEVAGEKEDEKMGEGKAEEINGSSKAEVLDKLEEKTENGSVDKGATTTNGSSGAAQTGDTIPGDSSHLDHPENWATGDEPATEKQKGYIKVLEKQNGVSGGPVEDLGKSEASERIEELK